MAPLVTPADRDLNDPTDDVRELNQVASDAEEDHGRVALRELAAGRGG
jgi:hypothetical protein